VLWKEAQEQDSKAAKAEVAGDLAAAKTYRDKAVALKQDAEVKWMHGDNPRRAITWDYSLADRLDSDERHMREAVQLDPDSPRPRNGLGRVLLRKSQQLEMDAQRAVPGKP